LPDINNSNKIKSIPFKSSYIFHKAALLKRACGFLLHYSKYAKNQGTLVQTGFIFANFRRKRRKRWTVLSLFVRMNLFFDFSAICVRLPA